MHNLRENQLDGLSLDNIHERIEELKRMFPEAVKEGRLDYDTFMTLLGDEFDNDREKYNFEWKGKNDSLKLAQRRSDGTLRPDLDQSRDWETTENLYLEGDNLEVMKLLQQGYLRKIKMIYIDPPYNTGNDFVYEDNYADPIAKYKKLTNQAMRANAETAGRYHSNWLSMMYPRLKIAKTLLADDGVIFISIDDREVHNLRKICDDVFGEENFAAEVIWEKVYSPRMDVIGFSTSHDYILCYVRRDLSVIKKESFSQNNSQFNYVDANSGRKYRRRSVRKEGSQSLRSDRPNLFYPLIAPDGTELYPIKPDGTEGRWRWEAETYRRNCEEGLVEWVITENSWQVYAKQYQDEESLRPVGTLWKHDVVGHNHTAAEQLKSLMSAVIFDSPKPVSLLLKILDIATDKDSIVLDFFAGSSTLAHAVMQLNAEDGGNRKFIMIQIAEPTSEDSEAYKAGYKSIADIGKERIRRAGNKIMSEWKQKHEGQLLTDSDNTPPDIGFRVFRLDSSNLIKWDDSYIAPDDVDLFYKRLEANLDIIKPDRRDIDLIYEVFLKYGFPLTEKLSTLDIDSKRFYVVGESGYAFICLAKDISPDTVEAAAKHCPGGMIFSDHCFTDDNDLENAGLILERFYIDLRWI